LSLIAFKQYVLEEVVTPSKIQRIFGKNSIFDINELQTMSLIQITQKGSKREIAVTEEFLNLFKLPDKSKDIKVAIQRGLREYAMSQLQMD
jgi:chromosome segregation and condensation protein ScpB